MEPSYTAHTILPLSCSVVQDKLYFMTECSLVQHIKSQFSVLNCILYKIWGTLHLTKVFKYLDKAMQVYVLLVPSQATREYYSVDIPLRGSCSLLI